MDITRQHSIPLLSLTVGCTVVTAVGNVVLVVMEQGNLSVPEKLHVALYLHYDRVQARPSCG